MIKKYLSILTIIIFLTLSCVKSSNLGGYSELATNTKISRVAILPFDPGDDFARQAEGLTLFHMKNNNGLKYFSSDTLVTILDLPYLYPSKLNERTINALSMAFSIDIIICGTTVFRSRYNQWSKKYKYDYDLEIKLIDPKGEIVGKYYLEKQTGKLEDGIKQLCLTISKDMRWSSFLEEKGDIFNLEKE